MSDRSVRSGKKFEFISDPWSSLSEGRGGRSGSGYLPLGADLGLSAFLTLVLSSALVSLLFFLGSGFVVAIFGWVKAMIIVFANMNYKSIY